MRNKKSKTSVKNDAVIPAKAGIHPRKPRLAIPLADGFGKRLAAYAAGAGAAGVGLLALAQPAQAEIVYTRTHITLTRGYLDLDLNNDGRADFQLFDSFERTRSYAPDILALAGGVSSQNAGVVSGSLNYFPAALEAGYKIGPGDTFIRLHKIVGHSLAFFSFYVSHGAGQWLNVDHRYLGLVFTVDGQIHYGWAELSVNAIFGKPITAVLEGYAYETTPNAPIEAGQTKETVEPDSATVPDAVKKDGLDSAPGVASLGLLALGSLGLSFWRRKQEAEVNCKGGCI